MQPQSAPRGTRTKEEMFELTAKHDKGATPGAETKIPSQRRACW